MTTAENASVLALEDREILAAAKAAVKKILPDATLILFGSAARGERKPDSDYDLLVLTERALSNAEQSAVRDALFSIELERGPVLCTLFYSKSEWAAPRTCVNPFHAAVERDAILL
jgi:predicted nucleotidyltransferase